MQTFSALEYLKIDIASNFGLDKENWDTRLDWFKSHEHNLDALIRKDAENPALLFAGIQAYKKALAGIPTGYMISADATASGMQILSCLMADDKTAKLCNVLDTGNREDAYTLIYNKMLEKVSGRATLERDPVKKAV